MSKIIYVWLTVLILCISGCTPQQDKSKADVVTVSSEKKSPQVGPVIELIEGTVNLGVIPSDIVEIIGSIDFINTGTKQLEITEIDGGCNCFMGSFGSTSVRPGEFGHIEVKFDKNALPVGDVERVVKMTTNDPANKVVDVSFMFTIQRDLADEIRLLKREVVAMRKEMHQLRHTVQVANSGKKPNKKAPVKRKADTKVYDVAVGKSPVLGSKDAPVIITEFVDLQCPYCVREFPKMQEVVKAYGGKVQVVFKHYPLSFHAKAKPAHAAVELALQEKGNDTFWKMHDMIMAAPKKLEIADLRGYAEKLGLDLKNFDKTMADKAAIDKLLATDKELAKKCGVRGTPTVMINGLKLADRSIEAYKKRVDEILAKSAKPEKSKVVTKK